MVERKTKKKKATGNENLKKGGGGDVGGVGEVDKVDLVPDAGVMTSRDGGRSPSSGRKSAQVGREVVDLLQSCYQLVNAGEKTNALRIILDRLSQAKHEPAGFAEADMDALAAAAVEVRATLAPEVVSSDDILVRELDVVRSLLAVWRCRESVPGGRLVSDTWGMAVGSPEIAGFLDPQDPPAELEKLRVDSREKRVALDRACEEVLLSGRLSIPGYILAARFGLNPLDMQIIHILLAPEVDPRYDRAYRHAWQDYTRKSPDVAFIRDLLDKLPDHPEAVCERFMATAPLVRYRLVSLQAPIDRPSAGLLHRLVTLSPSLSDFFRDRVALDPAVAAHATFQWSRFSFGDLVIPSDISLALLRLYAATGGPFPHRALLVGARGSGKRSLAGCLAWELSRPVLELNMTSAVVDAAGGDRLRDKVAIAVRDARLHRALLYLNLGSITIETETASSMVRVLAQELAGWDDVPVVIGARAVSDALVAEAQGICELPVTGYGTEELVRLWSSALVRHNLTVLERDVLVASACQPGLTPGMVEQAAAEVASRRKADPDKATLDEDIRQAVRNQVAMGLAGFAHRVTCAMDWKDIVLPPPIEEQLRRIVMYLKYKDKVFDGWGFGGRFPYGKGLPVLFAGPPGTGKTMAAGIIAREVGVDLFQVDLSQIVSKWIGETEKMLSRIFDEAERMRAAILFDEADSLFGKRTEQKTSTDRYANLEVNYLLQRIERYEGLSILTTNYEENIDEAFKRRLRFSIQFPFPDTKARQQIWKGLIPKAARTRKEIDWELLADDFELSGGNIKNAVLRAAFAAAEAGVRIDYEHLVEAAVEEYRAMGKLVRDERN